MRAACSGTRWNGHSVGSYHKRDGRDDETRFRKDLAGKQKAESGGCIS
jgi:hypothetical protein